MFTPNQKCRIQTSSGRSDLYGQPLPGLWVTEGCSVVRLRVQSEKSSVRADSSASRGNAMEMQADAVLLVSGRTKAQIDDILELHGQKLRVMGKEPRFDPNGRLDHYQLSAQIWSQA